MFAARLVLLRQLVVDVMQYRRYLQLRHRLLLAVVRYLDRTHELSLVVDVQAPEADHTRSLHHLDVNWPGDGAHPAALGPLSFHRNLIYSI